MQRIETLKTKFREIFPDFISFTEPGKLFHEQEYAYKVGASQKMHDLLDAWVAGPADDLDGQTFREHIKATLSSTNLANWRDRAAFADEFLSGSGILDRFQRSLHLLLRAAGSVAPIQAPLGDVIQVMHDGQLPANLSKAVPTLLLFFWNPSRFPFIKPRAFDRFLRDVGEAPLEDGSFLSVEMFERVLSIFGELREQLAEWHPRDMIDLQSFYWCTAERAADKKPDAVGPEAASSKEATPAKPLYGGKGARRAPALNSILYGPPGTGKTYRTVSLAVAICNGIEPQTRTAAVEEFDRLRGEGRIEFVTFHQSYGYEEFIEGIRPVLETDQSKEVLYRREPGIFKRLALRATAVGIRAESHIVPSFDWLWEELTRTIARNEYLLAESQTGRKYMLELSQRGSVLAFPCKVDPEGNVQKAGDSCQTASRQNAKLYWEFRDELGPEPAEFSYQKTLDLFSREKGNKGGNHYTALWIVYAQLFELAQAASTGARPIADGEKMAQEIIDAGQARDRLHFDTSSPKYVLVIDEINRGNISKIMGELITLLEPDKRLGQPNAMTVRLPGSKTSFAVPPNLYVVGTMNSADRSIAFLDTALRRRFQFEEIVPMTAASWKTAAEAGELTYPVLDGIDVPQMLEAMNQRIELLYDRDHRLGHSYFVEVRNLEELRDVFLANVIPLLQEYFYDDWKKVCLVLGCPYSWAGENPAPRKSLPPIIRLSALPANVVLGIEDSDGVDYDGNLSYDIDPEFKIGNQQQLRPFFAGVTAKVERGAPKE